MNCLGSLLELNVCQNGSLFPVNSLAGIDADFFHRLQKSDEPDIQDLFNDINSSAWLLFKSEFNASFHANFLSYSVSYSFGTLLRPAIFAPAFVGKQGFYIDAQKKSNYQRVTVKNLILWSQSPTNITIEFWDLDMSILLDSQVVAVIGGKNRISVNKSFDSEKIFVCYDGTASVLFQTQADGACGCACVCCNNLNIWGAKTDVVPEYSTLQLSTATYGLGADIVLSCEIDDLICENQNELLSAYIYAFGACLKQEQFQSKKSNKITMLKPEEAQASYNFYFDKMMLDINTFVSQMKIPDGFCAECKQFLKIDYEV